MNESIIKKFNIEIQINECLSDLKKYAENAYDYIRGNSVVKDEDEILACLAEIPDIVKFIDNLIETLEVIYENEQL